MKEIENKSIIEIHYFLLSSFPQMIIIVITFIDTYY